jgi:hypothetical protein
MERKMSQLGKAGTTACPGDVELEQQMAGGSAIWNVADVPPNDAGANQDFLICSITCDLVDRAIPASAMSAMHAVTGPARRRAFVRSSLFFAGGDVIEPKNQNNSWMIRRRCSTWS